MKCPVHNSTHHSASECWEIKKLVEQFREKMQQQPRQDGAPFCQREGKQKINPQEEKDVEMEFQDAKRALKAIYDHSDSKSSDNECRKALHIMFGGSCDITPRRIVKTLRREIAAVAPAPKAVTHRKWMETPIGFDTPTAPRAWWESGSSHCLPPQPLPTLSCSTS
jgi:hypothetical protein